MKTELRVRNRTGSANSTKPMSADELNAVLPWYAAGTLDPREAAPVEAALAAEGEELSQLLEWVHEELTETIFINEVLSVPSARLMDNVFKAIEREQRARQRH